jgi:hypothetical protein
VQECPVDYVAWESNLFTLEAFDSMATLYSHRLKASEYPGVVKKAQKARDDHIVMLALRV